MYAPEHALKGGYLYDEWDQDLVRDLVDGMTPRSARLDLQTRAYDTLTERIQQVKRIGHIHAASTNCMSHARINLWSFRFAPVLASTLRVESNANGHGPVHCGLEMSSQARSSRVDCCAMLIHTVSAAAAGREERHRALVRAALRRRRRSGGAAQRVGGVHAVAGADAAAAQHLPAGRLLIARRGRDAGKTCELALLMRALTSSCLQRLCWCPARGGVTLGALVLGPR